MRVRGSCFDDNRTDLDGLCLVARGVGVEGLEGLLASTTHDHDLRWSGASEAGVGRRTTVQANEPRRLCGRGRTWGSLGHV